MIGSKHDYIFYWLCSFYVYTLHGSLSLRLFSLLGTLCMRSLISRYPSCSTSCLIAKAISVRNAPNHVSVSSVPSWRDLRWIWGVIIFIRLVLSLLVSSCLFGVWSILPPRFPNPFFVVVLRFSKLSSVRSVRLSTLTVRLLMSICIPSTRCSKSPHPSGWGGIGLSRKLFTSPRFDEEQTTA